MFDHTIRIGDEQAQKAIGARPPVKGVHNDYTENSAPRRLRDIVGDAEAERRFKKRWAIIQVWRPIRGTVMIDPLGICDGRTIPQTGLHPGAAPLQDRTGEVYHIAHNPEHVWFYFPQMERDEALVFKVFDTDAERADAVHRALRVRRSQHARRRPAAREHRDQDVRVLGLTSVASFRARAQPANPESGATLRGLRSRIPGSRPSAGRPGMTQRQCNRCAIATRRSGRAP